MVFPHVNEDGKPYERFENFQALLQGYGFILRYNCMKRRPEVTLPGMLWEGNERQLEGARALLSEKCRTHGLTKADITLDKWMLLETLHNEYHPVVQWLIATQWDGVSRLKTLAETVQVPEGQEDMWLLYLRKWLIQGVAALFHPEFSGKGVLTFTGKQNVGKTSWLRRLVPQGIGAFGEGLHLDPKDKDTIINAMSHWIAELGELEGVFKVADIARLKAVLSNTHDKVRAPYGRETREMRRQTIFAATVNDPQFLVDQTGNSRWWVVHTGYINWRHDIDMQQVWAEAFTWYMNGESWHLTEEESDAQNKLNAQYEVVDPLEEELLKWFKWGTLRVTWNVNMTSSEVLKQCGVRNPQRKDTIKMARILSKHVGPSDQKSIQGVPGRYYSMPPLKTAFEAANTQEAAGTCATLIPFKTTNEG